jgi:hypothetical protein
MRNIVATGALAMSLSGALACKGTPAGTTNGAPGANGHASTTGADDAGGHASTTEADDGRIHDPTTGADDAGGRVQLWPGITEETSPSDLSTAWTAPWLNGTFWLRDGSLPGHSVRRLASCADLAGVAESDVQLGLGWEHYNFREKSVRCRVMGRLRSAHAARVSYVRDLVESGDPGDLLPADVAPVRNGEGLRSWRAADPTLTFDREGARGGYHELIVHGAYRGRLTWWGAGDFDGDGIEDVVMFSNLTPNRDGGSGLSIMRAFALTRREPGGTVTVVERFD